jgi:hypothetical protein
MESGGRAQQRSRGVCDRGDVAIDVCGGDILASRAKAGR